MSKKISAGNSGIVRGIKMAAEAIGATVGPRGKCVAIQSSFGAPNITRDGATVAKSLSSKDPEESMGIELVKAASVKTEEVVGDATSTTAILTEAIVSGGLRHAQDPKINMNEFKIGLEKTLDIVKGMLVGESVQVDGDLERIRRVATISANNDPKIGDLIVECMEKVGMDGVITADYSSGLDTVVEITKGFKIERGWASPHFVTSAADGKCVLENPVIMVISERLSSIPPLAPILEAVVKQGRSLLIVADEADEVVLNMLSFNVIQGALKCCVVKGIDFGDSRKNIMEDISVAVGATHICQEYGNSLAKATIDMLGSAEKVVVGKDSTIIYGGTGDPEEIGTRLQVLKDRMASKDTSPYEKSKFKSRISGLSGGVAVIKAGGASETERTNRKETIEDAILASQSALSEGVCAGGGYTLSKIAWDFESGETVCQMSDSEFAGSLTLLEAMFSVTKRVAENYGISGDVVLENCRSKGLGFNAVTGKYEDLMESGVIDSSKGIRVALENAVAAAGMALLTAWTVTDVEEDNK